ncbi:TIGR03668 family PPOX class F420-dependent oxidoreductase [Jatrophihabitans telluris]|uniref:TIGR03668 family PPOX class F420-dependent oxidoreductase n=1 Tax=Jatrophihabitans telluris TaxID=2038343 RepID=A0ABY4QXG1_9ACTN|nr:TIGR03668 family PPOX class F420-dependent oxidoreductase [Jatrophihabitans telluris]UQX87511.1 TIGR03668 family PPOX class F420-dependent oxidoreductase [Jatrophihabitans telluris]
MDDEQMRRHLGLARVARLATLAASSGDPHQVPICFALEGNTVYSVIDGKPKTTLGLRRIDNIRSDARACLLVDYYSDDWSSLWWIRIDTHAREVDRTDERSRALTALRGKYPQYREQTLTGAVLAFDIENWAAWQSTPG